MIHHIPGRLIRPSRCSNTISMVFSFQTVRFSRTAPSVKTEAASSSCRRPKGRAAAQGLETWKVCSFRFFPSRLLPGAGLLYIRTSPLQDCKCRGGKYWEESIQIVSIAQGQHPRPLSHRCAMPDSPFCRCATSSPGRGKSALKVGALGSPRKLHLFAKASPFGRGGSEQSELTERARTLPISVFYSSTSYSRVWNTKGSCFSQLASLWVPPGTMRLVRWMPRVISLPLKAENCRRMPSWLPISREP